ncbi:MAG: hypothetical protein HW383_754 [Candidatus Magasanikbacteria bacterium]|nr:hypothetical protein [Candidatus Magasanikbacteria bacterium]
MTSLNYQPWKIDAAAFPSAGSFRDQLAFLVNYAVLAPSGHNTQPWKFIVSENKMILAPEWSRDLPKSDPAHRQLFISLGCALENLLIAAGQFGLNASVTYPSDTEENIILSFDVWDRSKHSSPLFAAIPDRRSHRGSYFPEFPSENMPPLLELALPDTQIEIVRDERRFGLADLSIKAGIAAMTDDFRDELSQYVIPNYSNRMVGMPGKCHNMPLPVSMIAGWLIKRVNVAKMNEGVERKLLERASPAFGIVTAIGDSRRDWIRAGQTFERAALHATWRGMATAPLAAAVQVGDFFRDVQKILGTMMRPLVMFRIGYPKKSAPHSPRLPASTVTQLA